MNTIMHTRIAQRASELVHDCPSELAENMAAAANDPDYFYGVPADEMKAEQAECIWIPDVGNCHQALNPLKLRETFPPLSDYWLAKAFGKLNAGDIAGAGRMLGCWSHLCGDTAQAAHLMNERVLADIFPQKNACYITHRTIEAVSAELAIENYAPRMLAKSLPELQWRAIEELAILHRREKVELPIMLNAIEQHDEVTQTESAGRSALHAAQLNADIVHTLLAIAGVAKATEYSLPDICELVPVDEFCDSYYNYRPMIDRVPSGNIYHPHSLDIGTGPIHGISMLVYLTPHYEKVREAYAEYVLPGKDVFRTFTVLCGLQRGVVNDTKAVFQISLDGICAAESPELSAESPAYKLQVNPGTAVRLKLSVRDARKDARQTKFFYPVWGAIRLC